MMKSSKPQTELENASLMTLEEAIALVDSLTWTFAKTMPFIPHWYILRDRDLDSKRFEDLVRYIHNTGCPGRWGRKPRSTVLEGGRIIEGLIYCDIGDHRYWTMGWPIGEDTVINREDISTSTVRFIDVNYLERRPELSDL
jgi:hypothetical protein